MTTENTTDPYGLSTLLALQRVRDSLIALGWAPPSAQRTARLQDAEQAVVQAARAVVEQRGEALGWLRQAVERLEQVEREEANRD